MKTLAPFRSILLLTCLCGTLVVLSGCSFFGMASLGPEATPTPTVDASRALLPTFTPTPDLPAAAPTAVPDQPVVAPVVPADDNAVVEEATAAPAVEEAAPAEPTVAPTEAPAAIAKFIVTEPLVNVRTGPDTAFGLAGSVQADQTFDIMGKNAAGDWWLICCVNGQEVWIFGQLGRTENAESVALAENIPVVPTAAPVAAVPTAAPVPTQAPAAAPTEAPAPPPSADPCAGIGGDGCKFKVREGPQFAANGGNELKLQLFFIHSGIDGGQPQGSYFVVLTKDGQNLGVSDSVRSIANSSNEGAQGRYNYEYKLGVDKLPGNTVAGNYTMFVLDGNGERDSQDLNFTVPEGNGEVRVVWDQG